MSHTKTGANRLKGGLAPGWVLNHKTGTGQELGGQQAGYNDIGILTAPDGRSYSVAVMIKLTSVPLPVRMALMNNVVRAVIAQHDMQYDASRRNSETAANVVSRFDGRPRGFLIQINSSLMIAAHSEGRVHGRFVILFAALLIGCAAVPASAQDAQSLIAKNLEARGGQQRWPRSRTSASRGGRSSPAISKSPTRKRAPATGAAADPLDFGIQGLDIIAGL